LKITYDPGQISHEERHSALTGFIDHLIEKDLALPGVTQAEGDYFTAEAVMAVIRSRGENRRMGIQIMKMDEVCSYTAIEDAASSGGEGATSALLLYLVLSQLRAEARSRNSSSIGCFLLLDNPIAKASKGILIKAQFELANALGVQLIYATALNEHDAYAFFPQIATFHKVGFDRRSGLCLVSNEDLSAYHVHRVTGILEGVETKTRVFH
jgi:hypothetical protein